MLARAEAERYHVSIMPPATAGVAMIVITLVVVIVGVFTVNSFTAGLPRDLYGYACESCPHEYLWEGASSGSTLD